MHFTTRLQNKAECRSLPDMWVGSRESVQGRPSEYVCQRDDAQVLKQSKRGKMSIVEMISRQSDFGLGLQGETAVMFWLNQMKERGGSIHTVQGTAN